MAVTDRTLAKRIGIFGGTFDPPHLGHVRICEASTELLALDELLVVVANDPWQKTADVEASASDRLSMAKTAFNSLDKVTVSDAEIVRGGRSYMVDTIEAFRAPDRELFLILGADAAATLSTWHRPADLAALAMIAVVARDGEQSLPGAPFRCITIDVDRFDCSSSRIRRSVSRGESIEGVVPEAVILEIAQRRLYTSA